MKKICVVGLGFVGAPLAVALSSRKENLIVTKFLVLIKTTKKV